MPIENNTYTVPINFVDQYDDGQKKICANHVDENFSDAADAINWILANVPPVGMILPFAGSAVPDGYLLCNGAAVSRTTYSALFTVISTTYGVGDGSTTFNLPNLIDKFIEGANTAGTVKAAGLPNITGQLSEHGWNISADNLGAFRVSPPSAGTPYGANAASGTGYLVTTFDASRSSAIYGASDTVQPPAVTALPCIKY